MSGDTTFIIAAAGSGTRLGGGRKQFRTLGGIPVWLWSYRTAEQLAELGEVSDILVVKPPDSECSTIPGQENASRARFVLGGASRTDSVLKGLHAADTKYVMIHDAARPFVTVEMCRSLIKAARVRAASVPLLRETDSLKCVDCGGIRLIDRDHVYRTQTPQCFERERLIALLERLDSPATDEASVWVDAGLDIAVVDGEARNFKITDPFDWEIALAMTERTVARRTGIGYDVHELVPGRRLVLGGVDVPSHLGLLGHSDADVVAHAVSDALLGAAGEPDIGMLFPASDERYRDADSMSLLGISASRISERGWRIVWIDIALTAQTPHLAPFVQRIQESLTSVLSRYGESNCVNFKVKSGERVGPVGSAECMICYAVASIERCCLV